MRARTQHFTSPELDGIKLHTLEWGDPSRPTLVLLHGGGANAHWWCHVAPAFCDGFHVIALDFRGHGASDYPGELESGAFARDLEALLQRVGRDAVVVGHSMGGIVALDHAARGGDGPRALVLVDVPYRAQNTVRERRSSRLALRLRRSYATREEAVARFQFLPPSHRVKPEVRDHIASHSTHQGPDGRFSYNFDPRWFGLRGKSRPPIEEIRCPVLLVRGTESNLLRPEGIRDFSGRLPDPHAVEIADAGHHVHLDQPERFVEALADFLGSSVQKSG